MFYVNTYSLVNNHVFVYQDLVKQTPLDHPDYSILLEVQVVTQEFLEKISGGDQKDGAVSPKYCVMSFYNV